MSDLDIIDVHMHLARTVEEEKVVYARPGAPDEWYRRNGERLSELLEHEDLSGIYAINIMDTSRMTRTRLARMSREEAENPETRARLRTEMVDRLNKFNDWVCDWAKTENRMVPFVHVDIGVYYEQDAMMEAMERFIKAGARGVKIHPGLDGIYPKDERMFPLYERLQEAGVAVLSDSGALVGDRSTGEVFGEPIHFVPVFQNFPRLKFIMAHLLSAYWDEREFIADQFPNVYFDTAGGFHSANFNGRDGHRAVPIEDGVRFLRKIGTNRVVFGSDGNPREQIVQILGLGLTDDEKAAILGKNAREFIGWK